MVDDGICWSGAQWHPEALAFLVGAPDGAGVWKTVWGTPPLRPGPADAGAGTIKAREPGGTHSCLP